MGHLPHLDDRDLDRLLAGRNDGVDDELAAFVAELRDASAEGPRPELAARHLAAMVQAARTVPEPDSAAPRAPRQKRSLMPRNRHAARLAKLIAVTATAAIATAGLAVAGVSLPAPADDAFERVGVNLPNQAGGDESDAAERGRSEHVLQVIRGTAPEMRGCEFGHRVAAAARGAELPADAREACAREQERDASAEAGTDATKREGETSAGRTFGEETSERAKGQRTATPEQRRQFGRDTADRARQLGQDQRPEGAGPPAGVPSGPPEGAGPPEGTPSGPPEGAAPPAGVPSGPPEGAGPPEGTPGGRP